MRVLRSLLFLAAFLSVVSMRSLGQSQLLLPYNSSVFQATWENPAARPLFRISVGIPVLSSLEVGAISNGFTLKDVTELRGDGKLYLLPNELLNQLGQRKSHLQYVEASADLLHFRFAWREWFFWFAARHITNQSLLYSKDLFELVIKGNDAFVGRAVDLSTTRISVMMYNEMTLGLSQVRERLAWGARLSFLSGMSNAHFEPDRFEVAISGEPESLYTHTLNVNACAHTSNLPLDENNKPDLAHFAEPEYWTNMKYINPANPGFALAAGVTYRPERNTNISFSFSDVGLIYWGDQLTEYSLMRDSVEFRGLTGFSKLLRDGVLSWDLLTTDFFSEFQLNPEFKLDAPSYTTWLSPRMHLSATYDLASQTTAGLSFSAILHQKRFYPSATMSIQQAYSNLVSAQVAVSYNQWSILNFGGALVFTPGPVQLYVICDNIFGLVKPKSMNATSLRFGLNLVFDPIYPNAQLTHR